MTQAISNYTRDLLFVALTYVAGSVDALSLFGLGGIFASLLSGNTIVLAASMVQGQSTKALLGIFVFVGYIPGAALAASFLRKEERNKPEWTSRVTQTLGIEVITLVALFLGTYFNHNYSSFNIGLAALVFLAAFSMGIQYTCAKQVHRIGVVTTMVTGTLSNLVSRLVDKGEPLTADLKNAGSTTSAAQADHELRHPTTTTFFLATVWGGYFVGAASSAALLLVSRSAAAAIPLALVLIVVAYVGIRQRQKRGLDT